MNLDINEKSPQVQPEETASSPKKTQVKIEQAESLEEIYKRISDDFKDVLPLHIFARRIGVEPGKLILIFIGIAFLLTIIGAELQIVNFFVGKLYPLYMSINAMYKKDRIETKQWLTYWIIFCSAAQLDHVIYLLFFQFQSIYHPLKTMVMIWLYYPRTQGARIVYDTYIVKYLRLLSIIENKKNI